MCLLRHGDKEGKSCWSQNQHLVAPTVSKCCYLLTTWPLVFSSVFFPCQIRARRGNRMTSRRVTQARRGSHQRYDLSRLTTTSVRFSRRASKYSCAFTPEIKRFVTKKMKTTLTNQAGRSRKPWSEDCRKSFLTRTKRYDRLSLR